MGRRMATTVIVLLGFLAVTAVGVRAVFVGQDVVPSNGFSTSTLNLTVSPTSALASFSNMSPGDQVTAPLVVTNPPGGATLRYAITVNATNADGKDLRKQIRLVIRTGDSGSPSSCTAFTGTELSTGPLSGDASGRVLGNSGQGTHPGDRVLAAGVSETLCFRMELPISTPNSYRTAATTATFNVIAEQTANIP